MDLEGNEQLFALGILLEVGGSIPLPNTNKNKWLWIVSCTPFLFGVIALGQLG
jgi:hypothetical protein